MVILSRIGIIIWTSEELSKIQAANLIKWVDFGDQPASSGYRNGRGWKATTMQSDIHSIRLATKLEDKT